MFHICKEFSVNIFWKGVANNYLVGRIRRIFNLDSEYTSINLRVFPSSTKLITTFRLSWIYSGNKIRCPVAKTAVPRNADAGIHEKWMETGSKMRNDWLSPLSGLSYGAPLTFAGTPRSSHVFFIFYSSYSRSGSIRQGSKLVPRLTSDYT